jgi:hypothetical protein
MCGNHVQMMEDARRIFLKYDQSAMIRKYHLENDEKYLFIRFMNREYEIARKSGVITRKGSTERAGHPETMSIYDMLCYSEKLPELPPLTGQWESLSVLGGIIGAGHTQRLMTGRVLEPFAGKTEEMCRACEEMGGKKQKGADVSYILPVFDFFPFWFEFWDGDEEFPPNIQFLWDKNSLQFMHYETLWYIVGFVEDELRRRIS